MMKNLGKLIFNFSIVLMLMGCSESSFVELSEAYTGTWSVYEVVKDGEVQAEWNNTTLILEQSDQLGGTYQMLETPYDSIWSADGTWQVINEHSFWLDDSIEVNYWIENDSLLLTKFLPWTSIPCDIEDPNVEACPLMVSGQWDFFLAREN